MHYSELVEGVNTEGVEHFHILIKNEAGRVVYSTTNPAVTFRKRMDRVTGKLIEVMEPRGSDARKVAVSLVAALNARTPDNFTLDRWLREANVSA